MFIISGGSGAELRLRLTKIKCYKQLQWDFSCYLFLITILYWHNIHTGSLQSHLLLSHTNWFYLRSNQSRLKGFQEIKANIADSLAVHAFGIWFKQNNFFFQMKSNNSRVNCLIDWAYKYIILIIFQRCRYLFTRN